MKQLFFEKFIQFHTISKKKCTYQHNFYNFQFRAFLYHFAKKNDFLLN